MGGPLVNRPSRQHFMKTSDKDHDARSLSMSRRDEEGAVKMRVSMGTRYERKVNWTRAKPTFVVSGRSPAVLDGAITAPGSR